MIYLTDPYLLPVSSHVWPWSDNLNGSRHRDRWGRIHRVLTTGKALRDSDWHGSYVLTGTAGWRAPPSRCTISGPPYQNRATGPVTPCASARTTKWQSHSCSALRLYYLIPSCPNNLKTFLLTGISHILLVLIKTWMWLTINRKG